MWCHVAAVQACAVIIGRVASRAATKTDSRLAARIAATASFGAAVIHFAVAPTHWYEWMVSGLFFVFLATFQLVWARVVLSRTTTAVLFVGIAASVGSVALWALSRTAGAPFGPHAGEAELVQAADLCALLLQVYVVMGAGWVWYRGQDGEPLPAFANAVVLLGAGAVIVLASAVGVAGALRHDHHAPSEAEPNHHGASIEHADGHHDRNSPSENVLPIIGPLGTPVTPGPIEASLPPTEPAHDGDAAEHEH